MREECLAHLCSGGSAAVTPVMFSDGLLRVTKN